MASNDNNNKSLHIVMYPWFAFGHITSFLQLANKLAERGHKISFILPSKAHLKLHSLNHHPHLINFIPIVVPHVEGLPLGAETTNDVPGEAGHLLIVAMDLTHDTMADLLTKLKPNVVFFDNPLWIPKLARKHGAKSIFYNTIHLMTFAYASLHVRKLPSNHLLTEHDLAVPPRGFPCPGVRLEPHEARVMASIANIRRCGGEMTLAESLDVLMRESDGIGTKSCREIEGGCCEFLEKHFGKTILFAGPTTVHISSIYGLDDYFDGWLKGFGHASVVYCAFGSECAMEIEQFQELLLGLELTGRPFLVAMKPPKDYATAESAFPEGYAERIKGRGIVHENWVQQQQILHHPSVGCFITHCGAGSLSEALVSECQLVLMPQGNDQFLNAKMMSVELKVGVEVEKRENDGYFTKQAIHKAISIVMGDETEVGREVSANHAKWRQFLLKEHLEESYITSFIQNLLELLRTT